MKAHILLRRVTDWFQTHRAECLSYAIVLTAFAASYVGVIAVKPLFVPDSQFYLGMALWFSGMDQTAATEQVALATQAYGYGSGLSQDVLFGSGVVQPRVILPILALPGVWLFGMIGIAVTTAVISVVLVVFLTWMLGNHFGWIPAVAAVVLAMSSLFIVWYSTAMLTDSLSALWGAVLLFLAWRYQKKPSKWLLLLLVGVTILAGFTRQSTLIPAGAFAAAWVMSLILRSNSRSWGGPALAIGATTIIVQISQSLIFAPVKLDDSRVSYEAPTNMIETVLFYAKRARHILIEEFRAFSYYDHALLVLICLSTLAIVLLWRQPESHLLLGAMIGLAIYNIGNGTPTSFRYAIPGLVFYLAAIAMLFSRLLRAQGVILNRLTLQRSPTE